MKNGNFNSGSGTSVSRSFALTDDWSNIGTGAQTVEATKSDKSVDGTRNAVVSQDAGKVFGLDTGHTLTAGEVFQATYRWLDAGNWNDATDRVQISLFTTGDDLITGVRSDIEDALLWRHHDLARLSVDLTAVHRHRFDEEIRHVLLAHRDFN